MGVKSASSRVTAITRIDMHEAECKLRYENIDARVSENTAKLNRLDKMVIAIYPFILASLVFAEVSDATSQLISTILGGMPGETLGGRAARSKHQVFWSAFCKCLNFVMSPRSRNHCERALDRDKERSKAILSVRRPYYRVSRHG
jgi:hypothetical protein